MRSLLASRLLPRTPLVHAALVGAVLVVFPANAQLANCTALAGTNCREVIPDGGILRGVSFSGTLASTLTVPDGTCGAFTNVVDVNLQVRLKHNWVGDLRLRLVHPNGTTAAFALQNPGGPPAGISGEDLDATFNDEGPSLSISSAIPTISGTVQPVGSFSVFDGLPRAGTWTLEVADSRGGNYGALEDWTLELPCSLPTVSIAATVPDAVEQPVTSGQFTITRTGGDTSVPLFVPFTISGTATQGVDYAPLSGYLTLPAGVTTAAISVLPIVDAVFDNGEGVTMTLGPGDYTIGTGIATVWIWEDPTRVGQLEQSIPTSSPVGLSLLALAVAAVGAGLLGSRKLLG
ncbi:MAG: proprotein convertase P-domain-containing protein [Thermoanaerobaculia bacterium]|jgi:subtilisin-like proprotein convertase family protein|nr:proprotein convertase P-domain-containing protein [Thermoanaerobaculia bacterium]